MGRAQEKRGTLVSHLFLGLSGVTYRVGAGLHTVIPAWGSLGPSQPFLQPKKKSHGQSHNQQKEKGSTSLGEMCVAVILFSSSPGAT